MQTVVNITCCEHEAKKKYPVATITSISSPVNDMSSHPIAAVMGFTSNTVGYTMNNASDVLSDEDEEDELSSDVHACNTIIESIDSAVVTLPKADKSLAPLTVPHMFWWASYI